MPLAISNILWPAALDDAALQAAKAAGADGIEVAPTRIAPWESLTPQRARAYRQKLEGMGLQIPALQAIVYGKSAAVLLGDAAGHYALQEHLRRVAEIAAELGARRLVFGAPKNRLRGSLDPVAALELAAERLRPIGEIFAAQGQALAIEPVPAAYGADFLHNVAEVAALVRRVDHPGIKLHLDAGALVLAQEDALATVTAHNDILVHVHISRPQLAPVSEVLPQDAALAAALASVYYKSWLSIEIGPQEAPLPMIEKAIAAARQAYGAVL